MLGIVHLDDDLSNQLVDGILVDIGPVLLDERGELRQRCARRTTQLVENICATRGREQR